MAFALLSEALPSIVRKHGPTSAAQVFTKLAHRISAGFVLVMRGWRATCRTRIVSNNSCLRGERGDLKNFHEQREEGS
ncbi:MAG: hypothetical protein JO283_04965 [Bradyrhizobium sp.]|nr:hypothetical protein [Bradyrhizobium sp.]